MDASSGGCSTPPPWHINAVGGRPPHQGVSARDSLPERWRVCSDGSSRCASQSANTLQKPSRQQESAVISTAIEGVSGTGFEAQSSQTDAVKSLIRWESPHPLSIAGVNEDRSALRQHAAMMRRFHRAVEENSDQVLFIPELCRAIGASERTLRACCQEQLGMSPKRFLLLRRMHLVQRALRGSNRTATAVTEIATRYGFWNFGRFSGNTDRSLENHPLPRSRIRA